MVRNYADVVKSIVATVMAKGLNEISEDSKLPTFPRWRNLIFSKILDQTNIDCSQSNASTVGELADELAATSLPLHKTATS